MYNTFIRIANADAVSVSIGDADNYALRIMGL